jgi:tight adherence protein C
MSVLFWVIAIASFATVAFLTYGVLSYCNNRKMVRDRFKQVSTDSLPLVNRGEGNGLKKQFLDWVSSLGHYATDDKQDDSALRQSLIQAGFRHPKGTAIYFGLRFLLALLLPVLYLVANVMNGVMNQGSLLVCCTLAGAGFYAGPYVLKFIISRRQDRIDKALPDVLDLLIVCMEAGLSLQATINRVSDEVKNISLDFYKELQLTNAELRTGISRELALRNLGDRTAVQNVKALVGLMIQSDRMGASIAQALRTHAAFLRVQRAQAAEERAAKLPVKILFPLLLFIFPAIFVVVMGPAVIQMSKIGFFSGN